MKGQTEKIFRILENEYWYPGVVNDGYQFPLDAESHYEMDFATNETFNQVMPVLFSSKGRYIYADRCKIKVTEGAIIVTGDEVDYGEGYGNLKGAYQAVKDKYYRLRPVSKMMREVQYQYCTWMALKNNQNQKGILEYAKSIVEYGYPTGLIIIDDSWQKSLGDWDFNDRFEDPKAMVEELHAMGFKVSLWIAPYVFESATCFEEFLKKGLLIMEEDGSYYKAHSWLGESAVFDFCNPKTVEWFTNHLDFLRNEYGIDGFKFDGGDEAFIRGANTDCIKQNEVWTSFYQCDIVEYRSAYGMGGDLVIQRLADKAHQWDVQEVLDKSIQEEPFIRYGLSSVIPDALLQGLCGYYYTCPDMVGGGLSSTLGEETEVDEELVIRNCQTEALMPFVQFSFPFWLKYPNLHMAFIKSIEIRKNLQEYLDELFDNVEKTGEPILQYMEFQFPGEGLERVTDQFMLGERVLVAPICEKGALGRYVHFPKGEWMDIKSKQCYTSGRQMVTTGLYDIPVFIRKK